LVKASLRCLKSVTSMKARLRHSRSVKGRLRYWMSVKSKTNAHKVCELDEA